MKILWIVNKPTGSLHKKLTGRNATGGLWLEAMIERAQSDPELEVVIVNVGAVSKTECLKDGNIKYYTIAGLGTEEYDYESHSARSSWHEIISEEKPDLIELWGTEIPFGLAALPEAKGIPSVIYVQGILESIGKYYTAGMTAEELRMATTFRDYISGGTILQKQKDYFKRSRYEAEIVNMSKHIIIENLWAEAYYRKMCPEVKVYKCPLCISQEFERISWNMTSFTRHSIMCPAANYPIKGLHMLLKALDIVKIQYPDVKLYIPGTPLRDITTIKQRFKQNGYEKYIRHLIKTLNLEDCIEYTGRLTASEMAKKMSESNCFVMSSAIENHSSTLKEAMTVGVPCVASYVGGVPEYAINESNCLLYRFEDYEVMALQIMRLFETDELCMKLSENARNDMAESRRKNDFYSISKEIYKSILNEK